MTNKGPVVFGAKVNWERRHEQEVRVHLTGGEWPSGRESRHQGQRRRLIDTFGVDQVTHRPFVAAMQMVRTTISL